jgi:ABC-type lipoprotein export system ATPase subunit
VAKKAQRRWKTQVASEKEKVVMVGHDQLAAGYADRGFALKDGKLTDYQLELSAATSGTH